MKLLAIERSFPAVLVLIGLAAMLSAPIARAAPEDFNGDGKSDLLWRQGSTGATVLWLMNGTSVESAYNLGGSSDWSVVATGDFNGDGYADLIWRQASTGVNVMWLMNGAALPGVLSQANLGGSSDWSVVATGDFNGDGKTDLIWRQASTGATVLWLMNGATVTHAYNLGGSTDWSVSATGDFNGDGYTDLIWRQASTGATVMWLMNGASLPNVLSITSLGGSADWSVTLTGDFNGNGKTDLVWRQASTGATLVWFMNGASVASVLSLGGSTDWSAIDAADFNGDGKTDLVWHQASTGATVLWLLNGDTSGSVVESVTSLGGSSDWGLTPSPLPDFTITVSPSSVSTQAGTTSVSVTVTITALNGFSGQVSVSVSGLPSGEACSPSCPFAIAANSSEQLSFMVPANASTGTLALTVQGASGSLNHAAPLTLAVTPLTLKTIAQIQVTGKPILIFDHTKDQQQPLNIPDNQVTAWREADGTVNLLIPSYENYRMRGPDLLHLTMDTNEIFSSTQSASEIPEDLYDYHHWLAGPYSLDGKTFYSLSHSEWYACLLNANCDAAVTNGENAMLNSWTNTVNSFVSADGGAAWQLNVVNGNHAVVKWAYFWTGSPALADQVYLKAFNHTGVFAPTRVIKEGNFYYAIGWYLQRDFTQINPPTNDQAPVTDYGFVLLRSSDITNPNVWEAWTGGANYESLSSPTVKSDVLPFLPQQNGASVNAAPPQIVFDTSAQAYILVYTAYGSDSNAYYMTTQSLANPSWSQPAVIGGSAQLTTDPASPVLGFAYSKSPSILDNSSTGFNFEFTSGSPLLCWFTNPATYGGNNLARDVYCVQLTTSYQ